MATVIDIRHIERLINPKYVPLLTDKHRYLVLKGGTGSGKSVFACQKMLHRIIGERKHRLLVIRKVKDTLRASVFQLFKDILNDWGIINEFKINKTDMTIEFLGNGNTIYFKGLDDPEKLKSITGITSVWIEEATELNVLDFQEINRRLRGVFHTYIQIILTYNPILKSNWTYERFFNVTKEEKTDINILTTTYKDNKYVAKDAAFIKLVESYKGNTRTVFTLGEYGVLEHAIYTNWCTVPDKDFPVDTPIFGLDFGYIAPQALIKMVVDEEAKVVWVDEISYKVKQSVTDLASLMNDEKLNNYKIFADSASPDKINDIKSHSVHEVRYNPVTKLEEVIKDEYGFPFIEGAKKPKGSIVAGIELLNRYHIHLTERSVNLKKEIEMYQRKVDKQGHVSEHPEEGADHGMDAIRYALYMWHHFMNRPNFVVI